MSEITISELARRHGATLRALRFYEEKGLLKPRREGTKRFYPPVEILFAGEIVGMRAAGFTIEQIYGVRHSFLSGNMVHYYSKLKGAVHMRIAALEKEMASARKLEAFLYA